ncbi:MAG: NUDIX domain-containing protein [Planctomycetota bacterium]
MAAQRKKPLSEQEFLARYDASQFPHPSVAVDVAVVTAYDGELYAHLVARDEHPHKGRWALPGGFVGMEESLDDAATRVLTQKGGLPRFYLEQLYTFGAPKRDPRTRVIAVTYYALVPASRIPDLDRLMRLDVPWEGERGGVVGALDADDRPCRLAFDHADMLGLVVQRLRGKLDYTDVAYELLPPAFTLRDLQEVHETILGRALNKDSFRRRMLQSGRIQATGKQEAHVGHRPAALYKRTRT